METVLLTALSLFLFVTLFFPAVTKIKRRPVLVAYYSELLEADAKFVRLTLFVTCIVEGILAFGILFRIIAVITGILTLGLLIAFLGFRILILRRFRGRASCGCDGSTAAISAPESLGALVGTAVLVATAAAWMILA